MKIRIMKRTIITTYNHLYCRLTSESIKQCNTNNLTMYTIQETDYDSLFLSKELRNMLNNQPNYVTGYGYRDVEGNPIGHIFMMKRGGNEVLYKIRRIDNYMFAVRVFEPYRGRGYAQEMIKQLCDVIFQSKKTIAKYDEMNPDIFFTVKKDNYSALRAYEKIGYEVVGRKRFIRIRKINVPYLTL